MEALLERRSGEGHSMFSVLRKAHFIKTKRERGKPRRRSDEAIDGRKRARCAMRDPRGSEDGRTCSCSHAILHEYVEYVE